MLGKIGGGHGGVAPCFKATSYLINGKILIDAGSVASGLHIEEQLNVDTILISHPHLDHIGQIAFLCDNVFGLREKPIELYASEAVIKAIKDHLFNDLIWPDFSKLPSVSSPTIRFNSIKENEKLIIGEYEIEAHAVNHQDAFGLIITQKNSSILFTQDTGPTLEIWKKAKELHHLKAIFTEVSFPNELQAVASLSLHHTPKSLDLEIDKMPPSVPIFAGHMKPAYQAKIQSEVLELKNGKRITLLASDNATYIF